MGSIFYLTPEVLQPARISMVKLCATDVQQSELLPRTQDRASYRPLNFQKSEIRHEAYKLILFFILVSVAC